MSPTFTVYDRKLRREVTPRDLPRLARRYWPRLIWCDMEGFAVSPDGALYAVDECGSYDYPDQKRFEVRWHSPQELRSLTAATAAEETE